MFLSCYSYLKEYSSFQNRPGCGGTLGFFAFFFNRHHPPRKENQVQTRELSPRKDDDPTIACMYRRYERPAACGAWVSPPCFLKLELMLSPSTTGFSHICSKAFHRRIGWNQCLCALEKSPWAALILAGVPQTSSVTHSRYSINIGGVHE